LLLARVHRSKQYLAASVNRVWTAFKRHINAGRPLVDHNFVALIFAGRVLSGLAVLNCLQLPLLEAAQPQLLWMLQDGSINVQVCAAFRG
jgi:hypothetical protein